MIQKVHMDLATFVLVVPIWTTSPSFTPLMKMIGADIFVLLIVLTILSLLMDQKHKQKHKLSRMPSVVKAYENTLSTSFCPPRGHLRSKAVDVVLPSKDILVH